MLAVAEADQAALAGMNSGGRPSSKTVPLTKVNRCMAEGRKAFLQRFAEVYGDA
jgi:hypothetical protein